MCDLFTLNSTLYFSAFLLSVFFFSFFHFSDEQQPELNKKIMENLCDSATNGCEGTYDVLYLPTVRKPSFMLMDPHIVTIMVVEKVSECIARTSIRFGDRGRI